MRALFSCRSCGLGDSKPLAEAVLERRTKVVSGIYRHPLDDCCWGRADSSLESRNPVFMITSFPASSSASGFSSLPHFNRPTYLMCPPEWYDVDYVINPWMAGHLHQPSRDTAFAQWRGLYQHLQQIADVRLL